MVEAYLSTRNIGRPLRRRPRGRKKFNVDRVLVGMEASQLASSPSMRIISYGYECPNLFVHSPPPSGWRIPRFRGVAAVHPSGLALRLGRTPDLPNIGFYPPGFPPRSIPNSRPISPGWAGQRRAELGNGIDRPTPLGLGT